MVTGQSWTCSRTSAHCPVLSAKESKKYSKNLPDIRGQLCGHFRVIRQVRLIHRLRVNSADGFHVKYSSQCDGEYMHEGAERPNGVF